MKRVVLLVLVFFITCFLPLVVDAKGKKAIVVKDDKEVKGVTETKKTQKLTIAGDAVASKEQAVNFIKKYSPGAKLNCSVEEIVELYYKEALSEGVRPDVALSQALLETGFFKYGGDVKYQQNNFCGLGSVGGGTKGATFKTPELGVRAHIQHLLAYSRKEPPKTPVVDPRYEMVTKLPDRYGVCLTWHDLDGRWAAKGVNYGERILNIHIRLLATEPVNKPVEQETKAFELPKQEDEAKAEKKDKGSENKKKMREKVREILNEKNKQGKK